MFSVIAVFGSVWASFSRMMKAALPEFDSTSSTGPNASLNLISKVSVPVGTMSAIFENMICAPMILTPQRFSEGTTSLDVTGEPSWNLRPERILNDQVRPSALLDQLSAICGFGSNLSPSANRTS